MRKRYHEDAEFRAKHLARVAKNNEKHRVRQEKVLEEFYRDGCQICSELARECLCAHHLDPATKEFNVGDCFRIKVSIKRLVLELEKCVPLCQNCHARVHAGTAEIGPALAPTSAPQISWCQ
jgi:hypothetical protein